MVNTKSISLNILLRNDYNFHYIYNYYSTTLKCKKNALHFLNISVYFCTNYTFIAGHMWPAGRMFDTTASKGHIHLNVTRNLNKGELKFELQFLSQLVSEAFLTPNFVLYQHVVIVTKKSVSRGKSK